VIDSSPQYETNSDDVRRQFEEFGSIKTFFDLISTRGMVFVTYVSLFVYGEKMCFNWKCQFDLRAAERARDRLQGSEISGRPVS
jgi:transcription initiation factor TFIID subunit 15